MAGRGRVPPATDPTAPPAPAPIRTVNYRFSTDHGHTWSPAKQIEQGNAGFSFNRKWGLRADPNSNTLYAVWYGTPDPRATRPTADRDVANPDLAPGCHQGVMLPSALLSSSGC